MGPQSLRRTKAKTSENVASALAYQAVVRGNSIAPVAVKRWAMTQTHANNPNSTGVVRAMARSDPCRGVSTPRGRRLSSNVTSTFQRRTKAVTIHGGSHAGQVQKNAAEG